MTGPALLALLILTALVVLALVAALCVILVTSEAACSIQRQTFVWR